jgi:hypothetical protein
MSVLVRELPGFYRQRAGSFRRWLRTITTNRVRAFWRARQQRPRPAGEPAGAPPTRKGQPAPVPAAPAEVEAQPERPSLRPPLALLCILDDGRHDGEWVRLRGDRHVLGRTEGDIRIPHDLQMSGRHAELVRQKAPAGYRWLLIDLQSTNGTFVRIGSTLLRHDNELLIGRGRYRFEAGARPVPDAPPGTTQGWAGGSIHSLVPALVEVVPAGTGQRFPLTLLEYWIGRDPKACALARPDDVLLNPCHARLYRDAQGQWHIANNKSLNGLWLRIDQMPLEGACQFRLGEQRFLFRLL